MSLFFFIGTATTAIYTLSLHDALPISQRGSPGERVVRLRNAVIHFSLGGMFRVDRKSTRLNSSHSSISYAVFCLKKKTSWQPRPPPWRHHATRDRSNPCLPPRRQASRD